MEYNICESENAFKVLFYHNPQPMWVVDIETLKFLAVNDACIKQYGYSREEFASISLTDIRPVNEHDDMRLLIRSIDNGQTVVKNLTHIKKGGSAMAVQITSYTITFHELKCRMVAIQDLTLQKNREDRLKDAWLRVRSIMDSITDGFMTLDEQLRITYFNKEAENVFNKSKSEVINKAVLEALPQLNCTGIPGLLTNALKDDQTLKIEEYLPGTQNWISMSIYPNRKGVALYFSDVTNERNAQLKIDDYANRFHEVAHINSHQIRKEVANILGLANLLKEDIDNTEEIFKNIELLNLSAIELDKTIRKINDKTQV